MDSTELQIFIEDNITDLFSYLGAIQGYILAIIVLNYPKQHRVSNRLLGLFLFMLAHSLIATRITEAVDSDFIFLIYGIRFFGSMALLLYVKSLYQNIEWNRQWWFLFVVSLDFFVILNRITPNPFIFEGILLEIFTLGWYLLVSILYLVLTFIAFKEYKKKVFTNFSSLHHFGVKWVYQIFLGMVFLLAIDVFFVFFSLGVTDILSPYHRVIKTIAYTGFMYFIAVKGKLSPQIYQLRMITELNPFEKEQVPEEENEHLKMVAERVRSLMEKEKFFKEEGLSVREVADKIDEKPYLVSQAINEYIGKNFFELVNGYRVEESKNLMLDENLNHLSLVGIAYEAGFNSKTAFNTAFKRHTGMTPSQFKKDAFALLP